MENSVESPTVAIVSFVTKVGVLLLFKLTEAIFAAGHVVMKQASKNIEKTLQ